MSSTHQDDTISIIRASVEEFVSAKTSHARTRAQRNTLPGYSTELLQEMATLGWTSILVPESYGGLGLGFREMAVVLQELGRGLLGEPVAAGVVFGGRLIFHGDNDELKRAVLGQIAEGGALPCVAWQESAGGLRPEKIKTRCVEAPDGYRITGSKRYVAGAAAAGGFIVSAISDDGLGLYWIPADAPGLDVQYEWRADGTPSAVLTMSDTRIDKDRCVGSSTVAMGALKRAIDETTIMVCAEMEGVMRALLDMTMEYMRTRVQFGRPIGSFQALQHRLVDLYIQQQLAAAVIREAVANLDAEGTNSARSFLTSRAKARASHAGMMIARDSVQLHGAIAIQDECDVSLYLKRMLVLSAWLGNASIHRRKFAELTAKVELQLA